MSRGVMRCGVVRELQFGEAVIPFTVVSVHVLANHGLHDAVGALYRIAVRGVRRRQAVADVQRL